MTTAQIIEILRNSVRIQDPEAATQDSAYLSMTDEQILLYLNMALTRDFPSCTLDYLPSDYVFPLILIAKKELFYALAVMNASWYDIGAEGGYLKRGSRFDHYMKLIKQVESEYKNYQDNGGAGGNTLSSYDVILSNRYNTKRNYEKGMIPVVSAIPVSVSSTDIEIRWNISISRFYSYKVYISENPILDIYNVSQKIAPDATLVLDSKDAKQTVCRIENLTPSTLYYIVVVATDLSALSGYSDIQVTTGAI